MEMGANATCGHRVARLMAPTNSVLIVAPATGLQQHRPAPSSQHPLPIAMAISVFQDRQVAAVACKSSSSLLQFCLNYFACLFMVESLISRASVADNLDVVGALRHAPTTLAAAASAVAACVATI